MDFVFLDLSYTKFMNLLLDVISNQWRIRIPERGPNPFFASDVQKNMKLKLCFCVDPPLLSAFLYLVVSMTQNQQ